MSARDFGRRSSMTPKLGAPGAHPSTDEIRPREIEVHIEELVLHGFDPQARWQIADGLENELRELLATRGIQPAWRSNPDIIRAGPISSQCLTNSKAVGPEVARAIYRGGVE